jgi:DNA polymerase III alpha subunit
LYPDALTNTRRVAERCRFDLRCGLQELPTFPTPPTMNADTYLRHLCDAGRQHLGLSGDVETQLEYELRVIRESGLSNYFLIVWDIVRFAREQGILCQGRGSAANSLAAYLLGISPVNPLAHDLVFERFLSSERQVAPDIDLDFQADRREEVIQYVYQRYGLEHAAMACTLVTFRARSAIRDVGKALGCRLTCSTT